MTGFPKSSRLVSKKDFQGVFAEAKKISRKYLFVLFKPNNQDHARLGIMIKKQNVKLAVHRNRYRRWIRESFRYQQENLKGLDILVIMRSECGLNKLLFDHDIAYLWQQLCKK